MMRGASLSATILLYGTTFAGQAHAQTALDTASVSPPAMLTGSTTELRVTKTSKDGGFAITVTNKTDKAVTGAIVMEKMGKGLLCPAENSVIATGSGAPSGSFTLADLLKSGITLNTLSAGQSVVLFYSCQAS